MRTNLTSVCVVASLVAAVAVPAVADPGRGAAVLCYVWANNPSPALNVPYTPSNVYSYNAVGRAPANTVTRTALGTYVVTCKGLGGGALFAITGIDQASEGVSTGGVDNRTADEATPQASGSWGPGGHVQVTAYGGEDADQCKVVNWVTGGADFSVNVRCYNHTGGLSDNRFDMLFVW